MAPTNTAAVLVSEKAKPFTVREEPYTPPQSHEIVIKTAAVAINPVDYIVQLYAAFPLQYPTVIGEDAAGTVVEVGADVTGFAVGDRVLGHSIALSTGQAAQGTFQHYVVLKDHMSAKIPESLSFASAASLPLGVSTASTALFEKSTLALAYPSLCPEKQKQNKTVFIWGGSSSVGSNAIQLATAAGYDVVATASERNFEQLRKLGAATLVDYKSESAVEDLVAALKGKQLAGTFVTANGGDAPTAAVLAKLDPKEAGEGVKTFVSAVQVTKDEFEGGVTGKAILGTIISKSEVSKKVYGEFLPKALAEGKYQAKPDPEVIGEGLENVQAGVDLLLKGVSAKKLIVTFP